MTKRKHMSRRHPSFLFFTTSLFVLAVLIGQFLIYHDYYFDILQTKYYYFVACSVIMLALFGIYVLLMIPKIAKEKKKMKRMNLKTVLNITDVCVILFALIALISAMLSPFLYEAFWGNEGRYSGAFLILLYTAVYFCLSRYYHPKQLHLEAFLIAGMLMCLHGITDFCGMDILHFKAQMMPEQRFTFTSTIGNINTYTSCVALVMAVAGVLFAADAGIPGNIWHGFCVAISFVALVTGASDNAYLSLAAFFGFLPLYLFRSKKGIKKYFLLLTMFLSSVRGIGYVTERYGINYVDMGNIYKYLLEFLQIYPIIWILWVAVLCIYGIEIILWACKRYGNSKLKNFCLPEPSLWLSRSWWIVIILMAAVVVYALYDVNVTGHTERYGRMLEYLQFNDGWGTGRGYAWRIAVEDYKEFPLLQKIFGYGPDTFGIVTRINNWEEMVSEHGVRYDSAHNEYLQYFVTIGPFGLVAYLGIFFSTVWTTVKRKLDNPMAMAALFAVICYHAQAVVNINQPISTPVMWVLLCICAARREEAETDRT